MKSKWTQIGILIAVLAVGLTPAPAQVGGTDSPIEEGFLGRLLALSRFPALPTLTLRLVTEIDLPGPLPGTGPRLVGDRIEIAVAGGVASMPWTVAAEAVILPNPADGPDDGVGETEDGWAEDPNGRYRCRVATSGKLVSQKRCKRCRKGWRRLWKLDLRGRTTTTPLLTSSRIYFGSFDNRVYSLKKRNGHRMWATDVEGRISRPLMVWHGRIAADAEDPAAQEGDGMRAVELLFVLPDGGSRMVALDTRNGSIAARYELANEDGRLKGTPLSTPDGMIVIAREKYNASEATLMVFRIEVSLGSSTGSTSPQPEGELPEAADGPPEPPADRAEPEGGSHAGSS